MKNPFSKKGPVGEKKVNYQTRTVLLLDARNDLVSGYFSGASEIAKKFESKAINKFEDYLYQTTKAFIMTINEMSRQMTGSSVGIGDILSNSKGQMRFISNVHKEKKDIFLSWFDPNDAHSRPSSCTEKTMLSWMEK